MGVDIPYAIIQILCFIPAIVFHEVSHGFAAYKLGDPTAKSQGRLSLNPIKHIDPFGTVIMPLMLMLLNWPVFGYAKPVPYNPRYFKNPRRDDVIVGLAGPAANLVMALIGMVLFYILFPILGASAYTGTLQYYVLVFLQMFMLINLYLMFFNLIPVPPLDGSSVLALLVPPKYLPQYYRVQQYALPIFFIVVLAVPYIFNVNPISWYLNATAGNLFNFMMSF